ncbi:MULTISPECIES: tetratricopeptide repeat protein [Streptomyces]|uniref:Uncharacterized protein n=1 Tax=Streptomyces solicathayae TaxID=3081768 RepID=A0ABZ0LNK2_9ACTN|nr:hypothetical protein [Streptomyces sp. HUAS YS2]WOX21086.1 hypothetical protein R2D22_06675 [Streptomyces sp. HUAS YS2]
MTSSLDDVRRGLDAGDVRTTVRALRAATDQHPLPDLARLVERLARLVGFDDLATAAAACAARPTDPDALHVFGRACKLRGLAFLAVPALREALRLDPDAPDTLIGLVFSLRAEGLHAEAVDVLLEREIDARLRQLLVHEAILAGRVPLAREQFALIPPDDRSAHLRGMMARTDHVAPHSPLDEQDLRGWHFALTGGILASFSPYAWDAGMSGRWAYLGDSVELCRHGLHRLGVILAAAGLRPSSVSLLPDRDSEILGRAAALLFGLPAVPYEPSRADTLVVAYELGEVEPKLVKTLRTRAPGQVLFEHASRWTDPAPVWADVSALLAQQVMRPWGEHHRYPDGAEPVLVPADTRPAEEIAAEIVPASAAPPSGDGFTPADPDERLAEFAAAVAGRWREGERIRLDPAGPVPSNRFR